MCSCKIFRYFSFFLVRFLYSLPIFPFYLVFRYFVISLFSSSIVFSSSTASSLLPPILSFILFFSIWFRFFSVFFPSSVFFFHFSFLSIISFSVALSVYTICLFCFSFCFIFFILFIPLSFFYYLSSFSSSAASSLSYHPNFRSCANMSFDSVKIKY